MMVMKLVIMECSYWVTKLDINGNLQWQKSYGGSSEDELRALN